LSIKRILVPLPDSINDAGELDIAMSAAKALGAYVEALFISGPPPGTRHGRIDAEIMRRSYAVGAAASAQVKWLAQERKRHAHEVRRRFNQACGVNRIPILAVDEEPGALPAASWHETEGSYINVVAQRAAAFDLIVAASAVAMESLKDIAEQSLLQTRRPVLLAPSHQKTQFSDTAIVAWDESLECWHAVSAAIPFLKLARTVQVVSVDSNVENRHASQAKVIAYLQCHDVKATAQVVPTQSHSVGETLLAVADEHDIGLLVMGAYSHSRLREMLLGGATHHVLKKASTRPVLMAH